MPLHEFLNGTKEDDGAEDADSDSASNGLDEESDPVEMTINMGFAGKLARPGQKIQVELEDESTEEQVVCYQHGRPQICR